MLICYDTSAPKKPTSLTVNADLLDKAKSLRINISSVLETALAFQVREKMKSDWIQENADSIALYNQMVDTQGVFSDDARTF
jgi:antitoxin CcdA